jgi:hypothetical protein
MFHASIFNRNAGHFHHEDCTAVLEISNKEKKRKNKEEKKKKNLYKIITVGCSYSIQLQVFLEVIMQNLVVLIKVKL